MVFNSTHEALMDSIATGGGGDSFAGVSYGAFQMAQRWS